MPKVNTDKALVAEEIVTPTAPIDILGEYEAKMKELEEKLKQVDLILNSVQTPAPTAPVSEKTAELVHPNKKTKVTSLNFGLISLYHPSRGMLVFHEYGDSYPMSYAQLSDYYQTCASAFKSGYLYIHDQDMVDEMGLSYEYETLLSSDVAEAIFRGDNIDYFDILNKCTDAQQESFAILMAQKLYDGSFADYNVVQNCYKATGIDIQKMAQEMKEQAEKQEERANK